MAKVIISIILVAAIAAGGYLAFRGSPSTTDNANTNNNVPQDTTDSEQQVAATITYTDGGFSPATVTIKANEKILIKNDSSVQLEFNSNQHPAHTDNPELNIGLIQPRSSAITVVTIRGTHGYHNHLNETHTGIIVVQ